MHAAESRGEISPKVVHEFDEATKGKYKSLPEHVKKPKEAGIKTAIELFTNAVGNKNVKDYTLDPRLKKTPYKSK